MGGTHPTSLPPANEVCEGYIFTGVCLSTGGACVVVGGIHGCGGMCGCGGCAWLGRACVVAGGACMCGKGGHAWLWGACMPMRGMHGEWGMCGEGRHVWQRGVCMVKGGMCGKGGACMGYDEIWSMSGRYASHWNVYLLKWACENEKPYDFGSPQFHLQSDWIVNGQGTQSTCLPYFASFEL